MSIKDIITDVLRSEVVPALGCTEPVAVSLCAARAYKAVGGDLVKITVKVSPNIYKNGMSVGIPGISYVGLNVAAVLGAIGGNPDLKLEVLSDITSKDVFNTEEFIKNGEVSVGIENEMGNFFILCDVYTSNGRGRCIIKNFHSNIIYVESNEKVIINIEGGQSEEKKTEKNVETRFNVLKDYTLDELINEIMDMELDDLSFLLDGSRMNMKIADIGLREKCGMEIGRSIKRVIESGLYADDIYHNVVMMTASGCDARMSGYPLPVMSSAGSGNNGLTAIIPVTVVAERIKAGEHRKSIALALSHITTAYIKIFTGRLSAMCGCGVAAAIGASVGICYLLEGGREEFGYAIKNMVGDLSGMICDGAKAGCSLKLSTAAGAALTSALLAKQRIVIPSNNGIVGNTIDDTIKNLGRISMEGMGITDRVILDVMVEKNAC